MEMYEDQAAYEKYAGSAAYKDFQKQAKGFFVNVHEVVNLPAKITLSQKGFRHFWDLARYNLTDSSSPAEQDNSALNLTV